MTETSMPLPDDENLSLVLVIYGLFIASLLGFAPAALVGVFMAHVALGASGPVAATHYRFQIRTFWIGLAAWIVAAIAIFWGSLLSIILIGIPFLILATVSVALIWLWAVVRSAAGLVWAAQGARCPRPDTLTF
ncbi:MAG: hypothetical protein ACK5YD_04980 [Phenylobacterium sp.]|jgi:uncharacterized membrane protein